MDDPVLPTRHDQLHVRLQSETVSLGSKTGTSSKSGGYHFQRFQGEGEDENSEFDSVNLLSLEAAEALCSRMKDSIPVEVCSRHIQCCLKSQ